MKSVLIFSLCVWMLSSNRFEKFINPPQINKLSSNYAKCNDRLAEPDDQYILSWKWAGRFNYPLANGYGVFYWNGKIIAKLTPKDYQIHNATYQVKARDGVNTLRIQPKVIRDGSTIITIDDITLVKKGKSYNYIVNGDFEFPNFGTWYNQIKNTTGWTSTDNTDNSNFIIGKGTLFNPQWSSQVCVVTQNQDISQKIHLNVPSYRRRKAAFYNRQGNEQYSESQSWTESV